MNESSVLTHLNEQLTGAPPVRGQRDAEVVDDLGAFGWLRGMRERAIMLELRRKDGNIVALSYGWLDRAEFNPSTGITLTFGRQVVRIIGRHLNAEVRPRVRLYEGLLRHRVPWICETDEPAALAAASQAVVIDRFQLE